MIYFHADIVDPKVASMWPAYLQTKGLNTIMVAKSACGRGSLKITERDCKRETLEVVQAQGWKKQAQAIRHVQSQQSQQVQPLRHD